ncbi:DUF2155 domain-containing protein [Aristophania vespae]|uniref:DUF2155 domain-containing protein n=1 Tax=Aristophania vespae TaxID=2697033 RepID=A0A6P1NEH3_9PROT|nr:DUF2155 domain-containing protein [Aristophania vespae]QHI94940.1 DUF2155 domain-containing protein [Aristophania vespae]QHI96288.1 DUF2155 domain-containing protein [Aristophania vespae]
MNKKALEKNILFHLGSLAVLCTFLWPNVAFSVEGVPVPAVHPADSWQGRAKAVIRVLNRLDSQSELLTLSVGEEGHYRSLNLKLTACVERPPTLAPETAAQLNLTDSQAKDSEPFEGWILAQQPGLSVYQSSLYDVQVVRCEGEKVAPMVGPPPPVKAPQITSSAPEKLDADGSPVNNQAGAAYSPEAPTSILPSSSSNNQSFGASAPASSGDASLPPPTSLLP